MNPINLALRGLQLLWTILIMGMIGNIIALAYAGTPSIINYDMFVVVFAMLSLFFLIPASIKDFGLTPFVLGLDAANILLWFIAAVATPAYLHVHSCTNRDYLDRNQITNVSKEGSRERVCREAQASTAFFWFGLVTFVASLATSALAGGSGGSTMKGIRRTGLRR